LRRRTFLVSTPKSDDDMSTEERQVRGSAQDPSGWIHGFLDIQCEVLRTTHNCSSDHLYSPSGKMETSSYWLGPSTKSPCTDVRKRSVLPSRSVNIIDIRQCMFRFESSCRVVPPFHPNVTRTPNRDTYFLALGRNIELLIFGSIC
jgi:hypothetical protein